MPPKHPNVMMFLSGCFLLLILLLPLEVSSAGEVEKAKAFFAQFQEMNKDYDPAIAELYSDKALIESERKYPDGEVRHMRMSGREYKPLIRSALPIARFRGDYDTFSDVTYQLESGKVRIQAKRYSHLKQYTSPYSLLVGPDETGKWVIFEELSQTRP